MREYKFLHTSRNGGGLQGLEEAVNKFMTDFAKFDPRFEEFKVNEATGWEEYYAVMSKTTRPIRRQSTGPSA